VGGVLHNQTVISEIGVQEPFAKAAPQKSFNVGLEFSLIGDLHWQPPFSTGADTQNTQVGVCKSVVYNLAFPIEGEDQLIKRIICNANALLFLQR
jgi:hypothetical protein